MGQKASVLSHNDRHTQRGGSFHLSNQASRRREAFKAAKKSHFSFGDEPYRHSVHQKSFTGTQGSRRQKQPVITCMTSDDRTLSPSKTISTPEKEINSSIGNSLGNIRQGITSQRSLNVDYTSHLIPPEGTSEFALTIGGSNRPQSPADSINRSLYGTSCSHHSSVKLSEEEDGYSDRSTHTHRTQIIKEFGRTSNDSTLNSLSRVREKISPAQSPLGYKTNSELSFGKSHSKLTKVPSPLLSKPLNSKQHTSDPNKRLTKSNVPEDIKVSFTKDSLESSQITAPPIPLKKRQSKEINKSTDLTPENLVAALLPPSPLGQRQKRNPTSPHNLSPYNLSPRSLSPSQCSLKSNTSGQSNLYLLKDADTRKDNQIYTDFQNNQISTTKPKGSPTPGIVINSYSFKNSVDYGEPNDFYTKKDMEQTVKNSNNLSVKSIDKSFNVDNEFHIFCGGDLLSINSKSDTSLSSVPFHKTPSIGLSPTAERGIPSIFFIPDSKQTSISPKNEIISKTKNINEGFEKSSSMDGFVSKSPYLIVDEKKKYQFKREREQEPVTKPQRLQLTRAPSLLTQLVYPRSVPDELNGYSFLDFQGHQLLSWMCHWCAPHLKTGHKSDLYLLGCQMCTCLIACQQLVISKRSRSFQDGYSTMNIFQPEQIYHWNMIQRDTLKDDTDVGDKRSFYIKKQSKNCSRCQSMFDELHKRELNHSYEIQRLKQDQELEIFKVKNEGVMKVCQLNDKVEQLERQVEKYRILAGIEGLARQMWHEEALTANSNLVMSKSPTLQSIGANKQFGGMKSCSTDTNDLEEFLRKEGVDLFDSVEVEINQSLNLLKSTNNFFPFSSNSMTLFSIPPQELKLQSKELREDSIYQLNVTDSQMTRTEESNKGACVNSSKLQRFPSIAESPTIDLINDKISLAINEIPMIKSLDCLIKTRAITAEAVKRWLDLQVPIEMIDLNLLQTIQDMIQSHSEITKAINFNLDNAISNNEMSFWKELNQVFQLEEKIQFIHLYKTHVDSIRSLDVKLNQFSFVTHLLQYSESLKTILAIILEACNIKGSDHYDLSLPLEGLLQLRSMTSQCDGGNILNSVVDKYIQISIQLSTCGNLNFPLPEPNDLALLTTNDMGLECLMKDLEKLEEGVKAMNAIARCILSCSRQSFTTTDITIYSSKLIELIKKAQLEVVSVKENISQCDKQYSTLQRIFSTNLESIHFFNHWLEFAQDFKILWIKKVLNFHRSLKESSNKQLNNKPVGTVIPRLNTSSSPFTSNQPFTTKSTQNS